MYRMPKTFKIATLGCKVNQFESEAIARRLQDSDWAMAGEDEAADICIINTCTVTGKASMQSRQTIRQAVRANPCAKIIVTGCYAESEPDVLNSIKGVSEVVSQGRKFSLPDRILSGALEQACEIQADNDKTGFEHPPALGMGSRSRPFLKIQDGCDAYCSYCIVPYTRGSSRSMPLEDVFSCLSEIHRSGYAETVLTGIHLGRWGQDLVPRIDLLALLQEIRSRKSVDRVRLSSIEPAELSDELIRHVREARTGAGRICPHFHIPLQSGDDGVLERMRRPYTRRIFAERITRIHRALPDAAIGTDVLVGFPGESDAAFQQTFDLVAELPITYLHVFPFSARRKTPAYNFKNKVPNSIIKDRCKELRLLGKHKKSVFYNQFIDKTLEVLIEGRSDDPDCGRKGMSANYIPVVLGRGALPPNKVATVQVECVTEDLTVIGNAVI